MTIKELYPLWYDDRKSSVKASSLSMYEQRYRLHLVNDPISDKEIDQLKNSDIQKYCNSIFSSYSRTYAKSMMNLLKSIIDYYYVSNDEPLRVYKVRYPSKNLYEKKDHHTYSIMEKALLTNFCLQNTKRKPCLGIVIALFTGLRIGEVCGLQWKDIDLGKGCLSVRRTVERFTMDGKSTVHQQTPKTYSSARTIPINENLRSLLASYQGEPELFVTSGRVEPTEPSSLRRSYMRVCKKVGVPFLKFHSLRHAFATELIMSHVDPSTVSALMGHHDASTTLNIYTHTNERAQFLAVNTGVASILSGACGF